MQSEMTMMFDTYEAAKEFGAAGFSEAQVEALLNVTRRTAALPDISNLATKADITALGVEIAAVRGEMATKAELAELKADLRGEIGSAKLQVVTATLAGMVAITAIGTVLSRLIR